MVSVWAPLILYYSEIFSSILHFLNINQVGGNETFSKFENYKGIYKEDSLHILKPQRSNCNLCNTIEGKWLNQIRTWWRVCPRFGKELATILVSRKLCVMPTLKVVKKSLTKPAAA